jgi:excisionase family DNA binding protein
MKQRRTYSNIDKTGAQGLLRPTQAARYLGISTRTLQEWRLTGHGPAFFRMTARAVRYRRAALDEWLMSREVHLS